MADEAGIDLPKVRQALSLMGWGAVLCLLRPGLVVTFGDHRVDFLSLVGPALVVAGSFALPLAGAPAELERRRLVSAVAVAVAWTTSAAALWAPTAPALGVVAPILAVAALMLGIALMVHLSTVLGAAAASRRWRGVNRWVVFASGVAVLLWVLAVTVVPHLPGADPAPGTSATTFDGRPVAGWALAVGGILGVGFATVLVIGIVLGVRAFRSTTEAVDCLLAPAGPTSGHPVPLPPSDEPLPPGVRRRVVGNREILLVDPPRD